MAIKYLNNIDLRTNELQYAVIQPLISVPVDLTAKLGQVYFNTIYDDLNIYTSAGWVTVGNGIASVTSGNINTITIGGTASNPTISANTAVVTNGSLNLVTGDAVYDFVNSFGYVPYTGATANVNLGIYNLTATSIIKQGGTGENVLLDNGNAIALTSIESVTTSSITANLEVGGIADQQVIPIGTNLQEFATLLLNKTFNPTLTAPTFALGNDAGTREIGSSAAFTLIFAYNNGNILGKTVSGIWQPSTSQGGRSGSAISYTINGTTQVGNTLSVSPTLLVGGNTLNATVTYGIGIQPLDSKGANYDVPYPAGTSPTILTTVQGVYPYFWYKSASPITSTGMQTAIANGTATKVVASSTGTITIDFDATGEYLAFAYPSTSTTKTIWYVTALNSGTIPGGVFGGTATLNCNSPSGLWSNVSYKIHVTAGLITELEPMQLRNS